MKKYLKKIKKPGKNYAQSIVEFAGFLLTKPGLQLVKRLMKKVIRRINHKDESLYNQWIQKKLNPKTLKEEYDILMPTFKALPVISIVIPVYNPPIKYLNAAINSVMLQSYTNWELCIADDLSPNEEVKQKLKQYSEKDSRIKVIFRQENGHISEASNTALSLATGEYVLFMDHDDLLTSNCLFEVVKHINQYPQNDIIYTDEDKIDDKGIFSMPHFKPDWAPDNLLSRNYMGHLIVIKSTLLAKTGGFRKGFEGSQDYDLLLRATEQANSIGHIAKVLYHWRIHSMSVALTDSDAKPYAYVAAKKALTEAIERRGNPGTVAYIPEMTGSYRIHYNESDLGMVSIIIPTKDHSQLLKTAIDSIISKTDYPDFEIILLNNNSTTKEFFDLVAHYTNTIGSSFKCIDANFPFNFSKLINMGVSASKGEYILMLNNDVEVMDANWLKIMVSYAQRQHTGAVGARLLYPDNTIQHAGVVLGLGGAAAHVFANRYKTELGYFGYIQSLNNYAAVTGACLLCRKKIYLEVGGMDERLDVEYNDIDLCLSLYEHGYYNVYVPEVELYHHESATRGHPYQNKESWAKHEENYNLFRSKWAALIANDPFYSPYLTRDVNDFRQDFNV